MEIICDCGKFIPDLSEINVNVGKKITGQSAKCKNCGRQHTIISTGPDEELVKKNIDANK